MIFIPTRPNLRAVTCLLYRIKISFWANNWRIFSEKMPRCWTIWKIEAKILPLKARRYTFRKMMVKKADMTSSSTLVTIVIRICRGQSISRGTKGARRVAAGIGVVAIRRGRMLSPLRIATKTKRVQGKIKMFTPHRLLLMMISAQIIKSTLCILILWCCFRNLHVSTWRRRRRRRGGGRLPSWGSRLRRKRGAFSREMPRPRSSLKTRLVQAIIQNGVESTEENCTPMHLVVLKAAPPF